MHSSDNPFSWRTMDGDMAGHGTQQSQHVNRATPVSLHALIGCKRYKCHTFAQMSNAHNSEQRQQQQHHGNHYYLLQHNTMGTESGVRGPLQLLR